MRLRVDELAARCGLSVDTVRYYQNRGLLPRPERAGRVAWYGEEHLERLRRVKELQSRGLSLAVIGRILSGELDEGEQALAAALAGPLPGEEQAPATQDRFDLEELARRTGVSPTLLEALEREGLLVPRGDDVRATYTPADEHAVAAGMALLQAGVPLSELLAVAREHDTAMRALADRAVDLFARYVRDPIRGTAHDSEVAAEQMVAALHTMLPAASEVVAHHFRRRLLGAARSRIAGDDALVEAGQRAAGDLDAGSELASIDAEGEG